jgi:hypothetical protein
MAKTVDGKKWFESRTIIAGAIATVASGLQLVGFVLTPEQVSNWTEIALAFASLVGGSGAILFRILAFAPVVDKVKIELEMLRKQVEDAKAKGFVPPK